jgi:hypothetical protein
MSLIDVLTQNSQTGRPAILRIVTTTAVSSFGFVLSALQLYDISTSSLGVAEVPNTVPIPAFVLALGLFVFAFLFLLSVVGIWQLQNFSARAGLFVETHGALKRGAETELSLRVATFRSIIEALAVETSREALNNRFFEVGKQAGRSFASKIEEIHDTRERTGLAWKDLPISRRLTWWADYDRSSGLGLISTVSRPGEIFVQISHEDLFYGADGKARAGEAIAYLLGGYCETVINGILRQGRVSFTPNSLEIQAKHASYGFAVHSS